MARCSMREAVTTMTLSLLAAAVLSGLAGLIGVRAVLTENKKNRLTLVFMLLSFACQLFWLGLRGELRAGCPLLDGGEILVFLAWSVSLFYFIVGSTYRVTLLGMFSAPVVSLMLFVSLVPGMLDADPQPIKNVDYWAEMHSAVSVLSYGALALGMISAVMFLVLDKRLKNQNMDSGLFKKLPPVPTLIGSIIRLTVIGVCFLTLGLACGFKMELSEAGKVHLYAGAGVWLVYILTLGVWFIRGMAPRKMSLTMVVLFLASLSVFAVL